jgi:general secretion pathway protein F
MPVYQYTALTVDGREDKGLVDADSPKEARLRLRERSLHVTGLAPADAGKAVLPAGASAAPRVAEARPFRPDAWLRRFRGRRNLTELAMTTRQLATLLGAGIPLVEALSALIEQSGNRALEATLRDIRERVSQGAAFADALATHPRWFSALYVNMVRSGEASGTLDNVLSRLADYIQAQNRLRSRVTAALTYPAILVFIGVTVVVFLLLVVVPTILDVLRQQKLALPLPTQILVFVQGIVRGYWWAMLLAIVTCVVAFRLWVKSPRGRLAWDGYILRMPVFGELFKKQAVSRFASTFATLLESGLPVIEALAVVKTVVNNSVLENTLEQCRQKITEGADISTPLRQSRIFPPVVSYMVAIGEESGKLESLLRKISDSYNEEVDLTVQKIMTLIEPVMIVVMATIVAYIVLSIMLPILQISNVK